MERTTITRPIKRDKFIRLLKKWIERQNLTERDKAEPPRQLTIENSYYQYFLKQGRDNSPSLTPNIVIVNRTLYRFFKRPTSDNQLVRYDEELSGQQQQMLRIVITQMGTQITLDIEERTPGLKLDEFIAAIDELIAAEPKPEAIPISEERTPPECIFAGNPAQFREVATTYARAHELDYGFPDLTKRIESKQTLYHTGIRIDYRDQWDEQFEKKRGNPLAICWITALTLPHDKSELHTEMKKGDWANVADDVLALLGYLRAKKWIEWPDEATKDTRALDNPEPSAEPWRADGKPVAPHELLDVLEAAKIKRDTKPWAQALFAWKDVYSKEVGKYTLKDLVKLCGVPQSTLYDLAKSK